MSTFADTEQASERIQQHSKMAKALTYIAVLEADDNAKAYVMEAGIPRMPTMVRRGDHTRSMKTDRVPFDKSESHERYDDIPLVLPHDNHRNSESAPNMTSRHGLLLYIIA
jgi:hypothetical protein